MEDRYGNLIELDDIVFVCDRYGWIWSDEEYGLMVAWDLLGASLEDSEPLSYYMNNHCINIKVIGKLKR